MMKWLFFLVPSILFASWAEETLSQLTLDQKIGQLFIIPADIEHLSQVKHIINTYEIGGIIPKTRHPSAQVEMLDELQQLSNLPLLVAIDAEWGVAMRLEGVEPLPKNGELGTIDDPQYLENIGEEIGRQVKSVGGHICLGPVVDINTNPDNPIIGIRAFGGTPELVAEKGELVMRGIQKSGILACAKHFPGHGDVTIDSHFDLPYVPHSLERLEAIELFPFQKLIDAGVDCVMTAHLQVPSIDESYPSSLSKETISHLLREKMHFDGLVITDALNMKALARYYKAEDIACLALLAGSDILLYGDHIGPQVDRILDEIIPAAIKALRKAVDEKRIEESELDAHVLKILKAKRGRGR